VSDALSKRPYIEVKDLDKEVVKSTTNEPVDLNFDTLQDIDPELYDMNVVHLEDGLQEDFLKSIADDPVLVRLQQDLLTGKISNKDHENLSYFRCEDGRLYYTSPTDQLRTRLYMPNAGNWRERTMIDAHDSKQGGHLGDSRTVEKIARFFYWPDMNKDIKKYVKHCPSCQLNKHSTEVPSGLIQPLVVPERPRRDYAMDFMVGLPNSDGNTSALVIVDRFSKRIRIRACKNVISAKECAQLIVEELFRNNGTINSIVSDRDSKFTSEFWKSYFRIIDVTLKMSTARHQQMNGQSERAIQTIKTMLRHYINAKQNNWVEQLPMIEFAYNSSIQSSTGKTPFEVETGETPPSTLAQALMPNTLKSDQDIRSIWNEVSTRLNKVRDTMIRQVNKKRKDVSFEVGDLVKLSSTELNPNSKILVKSIKLGPKWYGPFKVLEKIGSNCYKLQLPRGSKGHPVFHVEKLAAYFEPEDERRKPSAPQPILVNGEEEREVEEILTHTKQGGALFWLVKWKGGDAESETWEPLVNLQDKDGRVNQKLIDYCTANPNQEFKELKLIEQVQHRKTKRSKKN